ncbi:hypothetical protein MPTK1_6g08090 [Marchantia polymorpha subsp. ruderalis]|uniref:Uncharacterized protein n=2 Tax=Marchantia polymorpha TaxID=3197 RepID=A0AAF6BPR7_MARPO|nr:hypothetical protein MARPO_0060s0112 [Marchantia polymorpha]BBN14001.1 hypothetical protein Mp_6g08090 [Marchantia polymorpha subsp. ruderalis]|eukprot:PTQ37044.1 hypothetical protein MARPO_0060s0112 [Marchantia polymorpha]
MEFFGGPAVASLSRPMGSLSLASNGVVPVRRHPSLVPLVSCLAARCPRTRTDQSLWGEYNLKSEPHGGSFTGRQGGRRLIAAAASYRRPSYSQPEGTPEGTPAWFWLINQLLSWTSSAGRFLLEQPGQLQFIEWPTVNTVVRMAVLTLIVVTCLIVLLATIDSTMSFVLASLLRRVP